MKRIIIALLISLSFFSCSLEEETSYSLEMVAVKSVEMPTAYRVDSITLIPISFVRPTACHQFSNFYYNSIGNERTVAIYCQKNDSQYCNPNSDDEITVPLNFKPKATGVYHFRFWKGVNADGVDQYFEHEVTVDH